jgi:hypothetical protein
MSVSAVSIEPFQLSRFTWRWNATSSGLAKGMHTAMWWLCSYHVVRPVAIHLLDLLRCQASAAPGASTTRCISHHRAVQS